MTYSLPGVPDPWKIKIFARERLETPHVSIICRTKRWRFSLRDVGFMDPKPSTAADSLILLDPDRHLRDTFKQANGLWIVQTAEQAAEAYQRNTSRAPWIADGEERAMRLLAQVLWPAMRPPSRVRRRLLVLSSTPLPQSNARREILTGLFDRVVFALTPPSAAPPACADSSPEASAIHAYLPPAEIAAVLTEAHPGDYVIGGMVDPTDRIVVLYRGTLEPLVVPYAFFQPTGNGVCPQFEAFGIADHGQSVRFGEYEASVDAVLYACDADYRRRTKRAERTEGTSFGSAFRRLRLLKGLHQHDFAPVAERTIRRIEQDQIQRVHGATRERIEACLGVPYEEIGTY